MVIVIYYIYLYLIYLSQCMFLFLSEELRPPSQTTVRIRLPVEIGSWATKTRSTIGTVSGKWCFCTSPSREGPVGHCPERKGYYFMENGMAANHIPDNSSKNWKS